MKSAHAKHHLRVATWASSMWCDNPGMHAVLSRPEEQKSARARAGWTVGQPLSAMAAAYALTQADASVGEVNAFAVATANALALAAEQTYL